MKLIFQKFLSILCSILLLPFFILSILLIRLLRLIIKHTEPRIAFGSEPLISNKYWVQNLKRGFYVDSVMLQHYEGMNKESDFDKYFSDYLPLHNISIVRKIYRFSGVETYFPFLMYCLKYDIFVISCFGFSLYRTPLKYIEAYIFKFLGIKTIVIPFGGDIYVSSTLNLSFRHSMLYHYKHHTLSSEKDILKQKLYWQKHANLFLAIIQTEHVYRWDVLPLCMFHIDTNLWHANPKNNFDGRNGKVIISHSPNHRIIKGTDFLIQAVKELQDDGLNIELILLEKVPNEVVKNTLQNISDIHVDQLVMFGMGMNAVESLSCGLPTISNFSYPEMRALFSRYSFLDECPIVSSSPETVKENLRILITQPLLRLEIGRLSRLYTEKYHSARASNYIFKRLIDHLWVKADKTLMDMFHPFNKESYNNSSPLILKDRKLFENFKTT